MKYICLGYMNEEIWETIPESERNQFVDECFSYDEELRMNGHFAGGVALQDARIASTLKWNSGKVSVTDGLFAETKVRIGGIMILEDNDINRARHLLSKHPSLITSR